MLRPKKVPGTAGQLTLEFMLGLILIVAVSTLLGVLTFTLTLTEALQYVTFSGARAYFAADADPDIQAAVGNKKAQTLLTTLPFLGSAQQAGWIKVPKQTATSGNYTQSYAQPLGVDPTHNQFVGGFQLKFTVPMLNVQIPFLSSAITPPEGSQDFGATLSSFLTREPAFSECQNYMDNAFDTLKSLGGYSSLQGITNAVVMFDNGC